MAVQGSITMNDFLEGFSKTNQAKYLSEIDRVHANNLATSKNDNVFMQTVGYLGEIVPKYKEEMITLYNGTFGLYDVVSEIPDDLKVLQASLLDSVCYGYNVKTGSISLYTLNFGMFGVDGDELSKGLYDKIVEFNTLSGIYAYRVDMEYNPKNKAMLDWKLVKLTAKTVIREGEIELIPFSSGYRFMALMKNLMKKGFVLETRSEYPNGDKVRCITENIKVLKQYCDSELAVEGLKCSYYPINGFFYAPVVGAPSTTSMLTKINIFNLYHIGQIKTAKEIQKLGVQKPKDPLLEEIKEVVISNYIFKLKELDNTEFEEFINYLNSFPDDAKLIVEDNRELSTSAVSSYLHSLKRGTVNQILKSLPKEVKSESDTYINLMNSTRPASDSEMEDLRGLFKNHICKILIKKKDGNFSTFTGTNSEEKLKLIYGENYFKNYESFGVKVNYIIRELTKHPILEGLLSNSTEKVLEYVKDYLSPVCGYCGFTDFEEDIHKFLGICFVDNLNGCEFYENRFRELMYNFVGEKLVEKKETDNILVRNIYARDSIETKGLVDYYRSIDPNKIVRVLVLD